MDRGCQHGDQPGRRAEVRRRCPARGERRLERVRGAIQDRHAEIEDILYQTGTKIEIVVVTSGTWDLADEPRRELEDFCAQMNDSTEIASYVYLNQERLYAMLTATRAARSTCR